MRHRGRQVHGHHHGLDAARRCHDGHPLRLHRPCYRVLPAARRRLHLRRGRRDDEQSPAFGCDRRQDYDCRNVEELAAAGDPEAQLAFDMFVYKIAAKAAEMATSMCGMDTLVFTAGIGEHAPAVRAGVADRLAFMGVKMDHARNALRGDGAWCLSAKDSKVKIFVIPTDEEFMIASDVERIVSGK
ncbi:MAG: hypothetical protein ACLS3M_13745 [Collinsella sp.]